LAKSNTSELHKTKLSSLPKIKEEKPEANFTKNDNNSANRQSNKKGSALQSSEPVAQPSKQEAQKRQNTSKPGAFRKIFNFSRSKKSTQNYGAEAAERILGTKPTIVYSSEKAGSNSKGPKKIKVNVSSTKHVSHSKNSQSNKTNASQPVNTQGVNTQPAHDNVNATQKKRKKLYRSRNYRILAGVAGGLGEYSGIEPTIIRLLLVASSLIGIGLITYMAMWIAVPERPSRAKRPVNTPNETSFIVGLSLIGLGAWFLLNNLSLVPEKFFSIVYMVRLAFWPITLILLGTITIIVTSRGRGISLPFSGKPIYRPRHDRKIAGVAAGIADFLAVDATLIRLTFIALTIVSVPAGVLGYIALAAIMSEEMQEKAHRS